MKKIEKKCEICKVIVKPGYDGIGIYSDEIYYCNNHLKEWAEDFKNRVLERDKFIENFVKDFEDPREKFIEDFLKDYKV